MISLPRPSTMFAVTLVILLTVPLPAQEGEPDDETTLPGAGPDEAEVQYGATGLGDVDFGANINSRSDLRDGDPSFRNDLSLWLRSEPEFRGIPTFSFVADVGATNISRYTEDEGWNVRNLADVNALRLGGIFPDRPEPGMIFRLRAGRFRASEPTGLIFSGRIDGIGFTVESSRLIMNFTGGYTGFIGKHNSSVSVSDEDVIDQSDDDVFFAPPRLLGLATAEIPDLIGRQSLELGGVIQGDQRSDDNGDEIQTVNSQYAYLAVNGPLADSLYYDAALASAFIQTADPGEQSESEVGVAGLLRGRYFAGADDRHVVTLEGRYGSGASAQTGNFVPVSTPSLGLLNSYSGRDLVNVQLDYSVRPLADSPRRGARSLQLSAYGSGAFRAVADDVASSVRGYETGTRITVRPVSDFGGRISAAGFFPGQEPGDPEFVGRLELSMRY